MDRNETIGVVVISALLLALVGAGVYKYSNAEVSPSATGSSSSSVRQVRPSAPKSVVLVDQTFEDAHEASGFDRLVAMSTVKLKGNVKDATISIDVTDGANVGIYLANATENGGIDEGTEWKRFGFVNCSWVGKADTINDTCVRQVKDCSYGTFDLSAIPVTAFDTCDTKKYTVNLAGLINGNGAYVGFFPIKPTDNVKATINYSGELEVTPLQ